MDDTLDAALRAAHRAYGSPEDWPITDEDRQFARALIAHIADRMARYTTTPSVWMGYKIALDDLREIAGIEPERIYEHNDGN